MKIKPQGAYILVKPIKVQETQTSKSGIIIETPDVKPRQTVCEVISIGDGLLLPNGTTTQFLVTPGDKILIKGYAGDSITDDDNQEEYLFILNSDILAIIE